MPEVPLNERVDIDSLNNYAAGYLLISPLSDKNLGMHLEWLSGEHKVLLGFEPVADALMTEMRTFKLASVTVKAYNNLPAEHPLKQQYRTTPDKALDFMVTRTRPYVEQRVRNY